MRLTVPLAFVLAVAAPVFAADVPDGFDDAPVVTGLWSPASLAFAPDGRLFVGERVEGRLRVAVPQSGTDDWTLLAAPFHTFDVPKDAGGQPQAHKSSGLRGFVFDPDYSTNGHVYAFVMQNNPRHNRVVRITVSAGDPNVSDGTEVTLLDLPFNATGSSGSHNGGALAFGPDGRLYVTAGDGWSGGDPVQALSTYAGKVFRIARDGTIPADNPFYGQAAGPLRAVYALGLRNPFALTVHPVLGTMHVQDAVGSTKSAIYPLVPGANYGHQGYGGLGVATSPWVTAGAAGGALVTGGAWYPAGGAFPPPWHGALFTTLWGKNGSNGGPPGDVNVVASATDSTVTSFMSSVGAVDPTGTTLKPIQPRVGPDGYLYYVLTSYTTDDGQVRRVRYTGQTHAQTPTIAPAGGSFANPVPVTLATTTAGATLRYTLDGTVPTASAAAYTGPFTLAFTATVKARAFHPTLLPSGVAEVFFEIQNGVNVPPIASAGPDQVVAIDSTVTLNGTGSTDPDGDDLLLSDAWEQFSGPPLRLGNADETVAFFQPPVLGRYGFRLTVTDGEDVSQDEAFVHVVPCVHDVLDGLAVRWRLDAGGGAVALDSAGGTANGAIDGAAWTTETPGGNAHALAFDGVDDVVVVEGLDVGGAAMSISLWMRADDFGQMDGRLLSKATGVQDADHHWMVSTILTGGASRLRFRLKTDGSTSTLIAAGGDLAPGVWTHVVAVYDGLSMALYKDAVPVGVLSKQGAISTDPTVETAIGNQPPGAGARPFDGVLDEVRIYTRALDPVEVAVLFANRPDRPCEKAKPSVRGLKTPP